MKLLNSRGAKFQALEALTSCIYIKYKKMYCGGKHYTPHSSILSQYFPQHTILLQFLIFYDMLSITLTYIAIYRLLSTANYVLKVELCQYPFYPVK